MMKQQHIFALAALLLLAVPLAAIGAATDDFAAFTTGLDAPYDHVALITPTSAADLTNVTRGILVGVSGDVKLTTKGGETVIVSAVAGTVLRIRATRIHDTSTTATSILALW